LSRSTLAALACQFAFAVGVASPAFAQFDWPSGYLQTVPLVTGPTALPESESTASDFNRFRLTVEPDWDSLAVEAAYEHTATIRTRATLGSGIGAVPSGGEWMKLQWAITDEEHALWQHRFDRLNLSWRPTRAVQLTAGRQAVSWGTTLFLTPGDPFLPFSPSDPFRQFRAGVDAARLRIYPSPLSEIDVVVRATRNEFVDDVMPAAVGRLPTTSEVEEVTALARGLTTIANWELSGWGGTLYGDAVGAFGAAGSIGAWAIRGEAVVRELDDAVVFRGSLGVDRQVQVGGRDLFLLAEYQHDGLAASDSDDYQALLVSAPFLRGELQVLGRDETVLQGSYQLHPLWSLSGLWIFNAHDQSSLVSPSFAYSVSNEASLNAGLFFGFGDDESTLVRSLPSEYGLTGVTGFVSLSWYF
jgi:hypothetical protein|tara:strand:+ start:2957 stop:4201 length:1245 start_codon:yes stop_codon:yes gene_type:complete